MKLPHFYLALLVALCIPATGVACTVSASGLTFGQYDPFDPNPTDSTALITVDCASAYTLALDEGQAGTFNPRKMSSADDALDYNIFTSASFSVVAGDGTGGTQNLSGAGASQPTDHVVHGRIFAQQNRRIGSYSDVIVVTISF